MSGASKMRLATRLVFTGLPAGSAVNAGALTGSVWTGTVAQAEALVLTVAGDFAGTINTVIPATTPEGSETGVIRDVVSGVVKF